MVQTSSLPARLQLHTKHELIKDVIPMRRNASVRPDLHSFLILNFLAGIFLHDPTCMAALLDPSLFTFRKGAVRVETVGRCVGHTILDYGLKQYVADYNCLYFKSSFNVGVLNNMFGVTEGSSL